jgi:hypothetical protein
MNCVGPKVPTAISVSWQTVGSTVGAVVVAVLALAAGTATASAAMTAARAARGFRRDNIAVDTLGNPTAPVEAVVQIPADAHQR